MSVVDDHYVRKSHDPLDRSLRPRVDMWIVFATAGLLFIGLYSIYSASFDISAQSGLSGYDPFFYVAKQVRFVVVGLLGAGLVLSVDYHFFRMKGISNILLLVTLFLLVILFVLSLRGESTFGATRGLSGGAIQPNALAQITMVLFFADWLSTKRKRLQSFGLGFVPYSIVVSLVCGMIASQRSVSKAALIAFVGFAMYFLSGARLRHIFGAFLLACVAGYIVFNLFGYIETRFAVWQNAVVEPLFAQDEQIRQSSLAIATGGLFGKGAGDGEVKYTIPVAHSDFVYSVWAEEFGFFGSVLLIGFYTILFWRAYLVARFARDMYGYLLAMGVANLIAIQVVINLGVALGLLPVTGVTLPLVSYGGSFVIVTLICIGILLNVSRDAAVGKLLKEQGSRPIRRGSSR